MEQQLTKLQWLTQLRWWAVFGQFITICFAELFFDSKLNLVPLCSIIATLIVSNVVLTFILKRERTLTKRALGAILLFDTALLTFLLYWSGGHMNPFSVFFLVHVTLAALVLGTAWTWITAFFSTCCFGLLFLVEIPGSQHQHAGQHLSSHFSSHLQGMWLAFTLACIALSYFLTRISKELQEKNNALKKLEFVQLNQERLSALATLSGGAAHELATPLSTISIAATEIERALKLAQAQPALLEDANLIASEVQRCRAIIDRMGARGGCLTGELATEFSISQLQSALDRELGELKQYITYRTEPSESIIQAPFSGLVQTLLALIRNAIDASSDSSAHESEQKNIVTVTIDRQKDGYLFSVIDLGSGIPSGLLSRVTDPFYTTKEPGRGMGLGLFLTKLFVDRVSGDLQIRSEPGRETVISILVPQSSFKHSSLEEVA